MDSLIVLSTLTDLHEDGENDPGSSAEWNEAWEDFLATSEFSCRIQLMEIDAAAGQSDSYIDSERDLFLESWHQTFSPMGTNTLISNQVDLHDSKAFRLSLDSCHFESIEDVIYSTDNDYKLIFQIQKHSILSNDGTSIIQQKLAHGQLAIHFDPSPAKSTFYRMWLIKENDGRPDIETDQNASANHTPPSYLKPDFAESPSDTFPDHTSALPDSSSSNEMLMMASLRDSLNSEMGDIQQILSILMAVGSIVVIVIFVTIAQIIAEHRRKQYSRPPLSVRAVPQDLDGRVGGSNLSPLTMEPTLTEPPLTPSRPTTPPGRKMADDFDDFASQWRDSKISRRSQRKEGLQFLNADMSGGGAPFADHETLPSPLVDKRASDVKQKEVDTGSQPTESVSDKSASDFTKDYW